MKSMKEQPVRGLAAALGNSRGYSLPELIVVMGIFVVVIMITANGFNTAVTQVSQQSKSTETQIGSLVGLELLRSDLQSAGYGLPTDFQYQGAASAPGYKEILGDSGYPVSADFWPTGSSPASYNDAGTTGLVPRAVQSGNTTFNAAGGVGSQYLVIKSLTVAPGNAARKWATVSYTESGRSPISTYNNPERDLVSNDRVIVMRNGFTNEGASRRLQVVSGNFSTTFNNFTTLTQPHSSGDVFEVYGVGDSTVGNLRMPFNRADYYVRTPSPMPPACAPRTGILYKAVASQVVGGGFSEIPLLDCVADMQVVYGTSMAGSEVINSRLTTLPGTGSAKDIREQLKEIRVYILAHEGKKDPSFTYPFPTIDVGESFGGPVQGRTFDLASITDYQRYRWKVYTIVVRPKNLIQ